MRTPRQVLILALILFLLGMIPDCSTQAQRFVSPGAREKNHRQMCKEIGKFNELAIRFNQLYGGKSASEVNEEAVAEVLGQISAKSAEMQSIAIHFNEEE